jgi:hypothetical protein
LARGQTGAGAIEDLLRAGQMDRSQRKRAIDEPIRRSLIRRGEIERMPQ